MFFNYKWQKKPKLVCDSVFFYYKEQSNLFVSDTKEIHYLWLSVINIYIVCLRRGFFVLEEAAL